MNVLIIGNGFDLAHGLPTRYTDFLNICKLVNRVEVTWLNNEPYIKPLTDSINEHVAEVKEVCTCMKQNTFISFLKLVRNNFWINHFASRGDVIGEKWINFEEEIKAFLMQLYFDKKNAKKDLVQADDLTDADLIQFCKQHNMFKNQSTYRHLFDLLLEEHSKLVQGMELYMDGYINVKEIDNKPRIKTQKIDKVLSFNYTNTIKRIYKFKGDLCYIHGKATKGRTNKVKSGLILGFDDHYVNDADTIPD